MKDWRRDFLIEVFQIIFVDTSLSRQGGFIPFTLNAGCVQLLTINGVWTEKNDSFIVKKPGKHYHS